MSSIIWKYCTSIFLLLQLRNQAETELRALRAELTQKKINISLTRSQQLNALGSTADITPRTEVSPRWYAHWMTVQIVLERTGELVCWPDHNTRGVQLSHLLAIKRHPLKRQSVLIRVLLEILCYSRTVFCALWHPSGKL